MMPRYRAATADDLIHLVYEACFAREKWQDVVDGLGRLACVPQITMHAHDLQSNAGIGQIVFGREPRFLSAFEDYFSARNVWMPGIARSPIGKAMSAEAFFPRDDLMKTEFYNDWLRPQGVGIGAGLVLKRQTDRLLVLSGQLGFAHESKTLSPLIQLLDQIGPHISRSFDLMRAMAVGRRTEEVGHYFDGISSPAFLVDRSETLVHCNERGAELLRAGSVVSVSRRGRLVFADPLAQRTFEEVVYANAVGDTSRMSRSFPARGRPGTTNRAVLVVPVASNERRTIDLFASVVGDRPVALVTLAEPPLRERSLLHIVKRFGLTGAELRLVEAIYAGKSLHEHADERRLSIHTARNQLRSVMSKMGVARQAQLVSLLAQLSAL